MRSLRSFLSTTTLSLAALSLIASTSTVSAADAPKIFQELKAGKKQTVVIYGTSLSAGGAWANGVKKWFETNYPGLVTFVNSAGPGQNSDWGLKNLEGKVLANNPDLIFVEFSYNDAHEKFNMPLERGAENLGKIVAGIQAKNPSTAIVLQVMNVGWDAPNNNRSASVRPQLQQFNDNYRKFAKEKNLPLLDHSIAWQKLKDTDEEKFHKYVPDGTHPSAEGSMAVTFPTVKAWLDAGAAAAK